MKYKVTYEVEADEERDVYEGLPAEASCEHISPVTDSPNKDQYDIPFGHSVMVCLDNGTFAMARVTGWFKNEHMFTAAKQQNVPIPEGEVIMIALVETPAKNQNMDNANPIKSLGFYYRVETRFILTGTVYKRLIACSEGHYDGKCKRASAQGGFIYGWGNSLAFENAPGKDQAKYLMPANWPNSVEYIQDHWQVEITASSDQLDLAAKICEREDYDLTSIFASLIRAANEEWKRLNKPK